MMQRSTEKTPLMQLSSSSSGTTGTTTSAVVTKKKLSKRRKNSDGSLDFERVVNEYSIEAFKERNKKSYSYSKNTTRWVLTIGCALISGLTTIVILSCTEKLVGWRTNTLANQLKNSDETSIQSRLSVFGWYVLISLVLADAAAMLCLYWPGIPEAVGSGIPEVKSYLNGIRVKKFNNPTLLWVKMVGSVLAVGSSMAVGMEGPLVMIGAYAGATLAHCGTSISSFILKLIHLKQKIRHKYCRGRSRGSIAADPEDDITNVAPILYVIWRWAASDLSYFANDAERRKLITIGAACGFAASFGAPIGGMLFILDDISTFFDQSMFLRILVANSVGTFCLAMYRGDLSYYGAIQFGHGSNGDSDGDDEDDADDINSRFMEIPWWIVLGIFCGILGGVFCKAFGSIKKKIGRNFKTKTSKLWRITYISSINSIIMFALPLLMGCREIEGINGNGQLAATAEQQFFCKEGETNQMATVFFGSRAKAIVRILSNPEQFYISSLVIVGMVFYVLMLYTNTTFIPSGLFTPIVITGATFGGAFGLFLKQYVDDSVDPSSFALLGVGAMMASIQRSTVSTCVILVEGTGQMRVLLPVMIVVVVANYVAYLIHEDGIYEVLIKLKGYPYLMHAKTDCYDVFTVCDVMSTPPVVFHEKETAIQLAEVLNSTPHNGFPVVDDRGRFKGLIRRKQIVALIETGVFDQVGPSNASISRRHSKNYVFHMKDNLYDDITPEEGEEGEEMDEEDPTTTATKATTKTTKEAASKPLSLLSKSLTTTGTTTTTGNSSGSTERSGKALWSSLKTDVRKKAATKRAINGLLGGDTTMPTVDLNKIFIKEYDDAYDSDNGIEHCEDMDSDDDDDDEEDSNSLQLCQDNDLLITSSTHAVAGHKGCVARVGRCRKNNVVIITWLNSKHQDDVVDLKAVMNRGTYTVPEDFPLSKAYNLFTLLGLRWIVVVGGSEGGVVGMLTRESFLDSHVYERTGFHVDRNV